MSESACRDSLEKLYDFLDGELPEATKDRVGEHLEICRSCYPHFNFERLFLDRLAAVRESPESRPELADRIRALLDREPPS